MLSGAAFVPAATAGTRAVGIDSVGAYIAGEGYSDHITRTYVSRRPLLEDNQDGANEKLYGAAAGYLYHPKLLAWHANGTVTLQQRYLTSETPGLRRRIGTLLRDYALGTRVLRGHRLNFTLDASRNTSDLDGDFLRQTSVTRTYRGAIASLRVKHLQQKLEVSRSHYRARGDFQNEEIRRQIRYDVDLPGRMFSSNARYEFVDTDLNTQGADFRTQTGQFVSTLCVDGSLRSAFTTSAYYNRIESRSLSEYLEGSAYASLGMVRALPATVSYTHRIANVSGIRSWTDTGSFSLAHSLYQSLVSSMDLRESRTDYNDGRQTDRVAEFKVKYRKRVYFGRLRMFYEYRYRRNEENFAGMARRPRDITLEYAAGAPIILDETGIDASSIQIDNLTRPTQPPVEGIDYLVRVTGDVVEIEIQPLGTIQANDRLRIRYDILVPDRLAFEERAPGYGGGIDIASHLSFTIGKKSTDRSVVYGAPITPLEDFDVEYAMARFHWRALGVYSQYQNRITPITPFKRTSINASYSHAFLRSLNVVVNAGFSATDFPAELDREERMTAGGTLWYRPTHRLTVEARATYIDRTGRDNDGHDLLGQTRVRYTASSLELIAELSRYERDVVVTGNETRTIARLEVRRHFR